MSKEMTREEILKEYEEVKFISCGDCELELSVKHRLHGGESDREICDGLCGICKQFKKRKKEAAVSKCTIKFEGGFNRVLGKDIPNDQYFTGRIGLSSARLFKKTDNYITPLDSISGWSDADGVLVEDYQPVDVEIAVRRCER